MAVAFGWKGAVDTDLQFSEFYGADHTVVAWFLPQYPNGYAGPIFSVNGVGTYLIGQGDRNTSAGAHLISRIGDASEILSPLPFPAGQWSHLAVRRNGNQVAVFLNGQPLGSLLTITGADTPVGTLRLGRAAPGQGVDGQEAQFYGLIDEVAVYNLALSDTEISTQFVGKTHLSGTETGLIAGWRFTPTPGTPAAPQLSRATVISGAAAVIAQSANWSAADLGLIPLPAHDPQQLPFLSGEAWGVPQGFAADFSHRGYAAFCWDFVKADVGTGWGDIYPSGSFRAPVYSTGVGEITHVSDDSPPVSPGDSETENQIWATGADGFVRAHLHLFKGSARVAVGQPTKSGQPVAEIATEWRGNRPGPHLHFAVNPATTDMIGWVTAPTAFSDYEVRQPNGSWVFVSRGIPKQGEVVRRTGPMSSWDEIGHANWITAMTAMSNNLVNAAPTNSKLFATTTDNQLWSRDPVGMPQDWDPIGNAPGNVVGLTAINDKLFAATDDGHLWWRDPGGANVAWSQIGHADFVVGMAATNGKLFAATKDNRLWWRDPVGSNINWTHIGEAIDVVAMAATNGKLFAATKDDKLWWRDPVGTGGRWDHIGHANHVRGMAGINGRLFAATSDNKLWWRNA